MYIFKHIAISIVAVTAVTYFIVFYKCYLSNDVAALSSLVATFGITLSGFFITATSILAGFSSLPYMQKVLQSSKTYSNLISLFMTTIVVNFLMSIAGLVVKFVDFKLVTLAWIPQYILALFVFLTCCSVYFTIFSIRILHTVLLQLARKPKGRPKTP